MDDLLAADGASYCPAFAFVDGTDDDTLSAALRRAVTDGCPEAKGSETDAQWWAVVATAGVATDEDGRPAHGEDSGVVRLGRGAGVLLVTDQSAVCALTDGEWPGEAAGLVCSFDLDEVVAVTAETTGIRRQVKAMTIELAGASWGAIGLAVVGRLERHAGQRDGQVLRDNPKLLAERLGRHARG